MSSVTSTPTHPGLARVERLSTLLDSAFRIPGTSRRVGIDPIVGLVPVLGDGTGLVLSLYVVLEAWLAGVRRRTLVRMLANVAVDAAVGAVPLVGDLFDAVWKANERNVALFRRELARGRPADPVAL
jgi:hypothetical protein